MIVYLIRNIINGKGYVGQTVRSLERRWKQHLSDSKKGSKLYIHSAIRKYGEENFEYCILEETNNLSDLNRLEIEQIIKQNTFGKNGYNLTRGGFGGSFGYTRSLEIRKKISVGNKGKKLSPEAKAKMSLSRKGKKRKPFSSEWRENISKSAKLKKLSDEHKKKISLFIKRRKHSSKTKEKMSISSKGKSWSIKHRIAYLNRKISHA